MFVIPLMTRFRNFLFAFVLLLPVCSVLSVSLDDGGQSESVTAGASQESVTASDEPAAESASDSKISIEVKSEATPVKQDDVAPVQQDASKPDFKTDLARIEANLGEVQKSLSTLKEGLPKPVEGVQGSSFVKTYASLFVQCLEERSVELQKGLNDFMVNVSGILKWKLSWRLWVEASLVLVGFGVTTFLGALFAMAANWWLNRFLAGGIFKWATAALSGRPRAQKVMALMSHFFAAILPICVLFLVQVSTFFLIEGIADLRNAMLSFATGLFVWLGVWRVQGLIFQQIPTTFLNPGAQRRRRSLSFALQLFLFFWILNDWLVELFAYFKFSSEMGVVVMFVLGFGMMSSAMAFVHALKQPIWRWIKTTQEYQFPVLTTLFWVLWNTFPVLLYIFFVFDEDFYQRFAWPLTMTTFLLPVIPALYICFRRLRAWYVLVHRHDPQRTLLFKWLQSRVTSTRFFYLFTYGVVGLLVIELWDLRFFYYLRFALGSYVYDQLADFILLLIGAWLAIHFGDRALRYYFEPKPTPYLTESLYTKGRMRTLLMVFRTALRVSVFITFSLTVLVRLQYNITPIITNLGLFSVVLSFGVQSFVKDFFAGLFSLLDNNVLVGDWVDIDGKLGIVEELTLRTIKVRADNGTLLTIPFGNIKIIGNRSRHFSCVLINLAVPYDEDPDRIQKILEKAYQTLRRNAVYRNKLAGPIEVRGVNEIRDYALVFQARIKTNPAEQEFVRRGYNRVLKDILDEENIKVPTPPYPIVRDKLESFSTKPSAP